MDAFEWRITAGTGRRGSTRPDLEVARLAGEEKGVLSLAELVACGLTEKEIRGRTNRGHLQRVYTGVYAVGHTDLSLDARFLAAVKACGPRSFLSHFATIAHYGFIPWDDRSIDVTVPLTVRRRHPGIRVHRTSILDIRDTRRIRGVPCTSPARTLLDFAARAHPKALRTAVRRAQSMNMVNIRDLAEVLGRLGPRRGSRALTHLIKEGAAPTRTELEDIVLDLLDAGGFARPEINRPMVLGGRRVIPDFRWPDRRLVVEADSRAWHDSKLAREDDAERQAILEAHGERVLRVTSAQAVMRRPETLERLAAAGVPRA